MLTIRTLRLSNFRGFKASAPATLAPLTFLVGPNSSGKTSVMHSYMFLAQSGLASLRSVEPAWQGRLVDLGSFNDVAYRHLPFSPIKIEVTLSDSRLRTPESPSFGPSVRIGFILRSTPNLVGRLSSIWIEDCLTGQRLDISRTGGRRPAFKISINEFSETWTPIQADRVAAHPDALKWTIERALRRAAKLESIRKDRRTAAVTRMRYFLYSLGAVNETQRVASGRAAPQRWHARGAGKESLRPYWAQALFAEITPDLLRESAEAPYLYRSRTKPIPVAETLSKGLGRLEIADHLMAQDLSVYHTAIQVRDARTHIPSNISDVGYGASQILPVLWALASEARGPLFIEQPEIHLHPKAQAQVGNMLIETSALRQVVVETHSEHLINQARIAIAEKRLPSSWVAIVYVDRGRNGSVVTNIGVDPAGDFTRDWPSGFFPERYEDAMKLAGLKGQGS